MSWLPEPKASWARAGAAETATKATARLNWAIVDLRDIVRFSRKLVKDFSKVVSAANSES